MHRLVRHLPPVNAWSRNAISLWEIWFAAPQVVSQRLTRMALAGSSPNARDRKEFVLMGQEKAEAFTESLLAIGFRVLQAQQAMGVALLQQWLRPQLWAPWTRAMPAVVAAGMKPVHRRVTANARRLTGTGKRR